MKTPQPKTDRRSVAWLRAVTSSPPTTVKVHAEMCRRKTITRRILEDIREQREIDMDRWN
jgi:Cft2 family RNA processing exonuclease